MTASCRCGRTWTGLSQAHCSVCHRHFSTVANFDRHQPSRHGCQDPATVTLRNGDLALKPVESPLGTTWTGSKEYAGPRTDAHPAIDGPE